MAETVGWHGDNADDSSESNNSSDWRDVISARLDASESPSYKKNIMIIFHVSIIFLLKKKLKSIIRISQKFRLWNGLQNNFVNISIKLLTMIFKVALEFRR